MPHSRFVSYTLLGTVLKGATLDTVSSHSHKLICHGAAIC